MLKKYRRRPLEVEAVRFVVTHTPSDDAKPIVDYINANGGQAYFLYDFQHTKLQHFPCIVIDVLHGKFVAKTGDYICRDPAGGFYAIEGHTFDVVNEPIEEPLEGTFVEVVSEAEGQL